jgi:hypothetical protein
MVNREHWPQNATRDKSIFSPPTLAKKNLKPMPTMEVDFFMTNKET